MRVVGPGNAITLLSFFALLWGAVVRQLQGILCMTTVIALCPRRGGNHISFLCEKLYGNYSLRVMTLRGVKSVEQESSGRANWKSWMLREHICTTRIYLSHSLREGHVCAGHPRCRITCTRERTPHFSTRQRKWHSSKSALNAMTNKNTFSSYHHHWLWHLSVSLQWVPLP